MARMPRPDKALTASSGASGSPALPRASDLLARGIVIGKLHEPGGTGHNTGGGSSELKAAEAGLLDRKKLESAIVAKLGSASDESLKAIWAQLQEAASSASQSALPDKAPALWADRTTGRNVSPVEFICQHYGNRSGDRATWEPQGLMRADIKRLDKALYQAYASWVRPGRHPEEDLGLPTQPRTKITTETDAVAAIDRKRATSRSWWHSQNNN